MNYFILLAALLLSLLHPANGVTSERSQVLIGFIENNEHQALRVAFQKSKDGWQSLCSPTKEIETVNDCRIESANTEIIWKVVFAGKKIGEVTTKGYLTPTYYSQVGLTEVSSSKSVPHVGNKTEEFAGWMGQPVYRPLISITANHFVDPEGWSLSKHQGDELKRLWPYLKKAAGNATNCIIDAEGNESAIKWNYQRKDIVFIKAFSSKRGFRLVGIKINPNLNKCDWPQSREWSNFWFVIRPDKKVIPLSPILRNSDSAYELIPLDFGNYDGDGKTQIIFWVSAYNEDGYVMFYDAFSRSVAFTWFYH